MGQSIRPISGGVMASGVNAEAVRLADYWQIKIRELQAYFERQLDSLLPTLKQQGFGGEEEVEAELKLSETGVRFSSQIRRPRAM